MQAKNVPNPNERCKFIHYGDVSVWTCSRDLVSSGTKERSVPQIQIYVGRGCTPTQIIRQPWQRQERKWKEGEKLNEKEVQSKGGKGCAAVMYPFVRQRSNGTVMLCFLLSAGSRTANENHGLSLIAPQTGSRRWRPWQRTSEGARGSRRSICQQTCASTANCAWSKGWN